MTGRGATRGLLALGATLAVAGAGCAGDGASSDEPPSALALRMALVDRAPRAARPGVVAWSTTWRLCWRSARGGETFELQPLTSEGPGRPRRVAGSCFALEVAAGEDRPGARAAHRTAQLAAVRSQLAYRVRAIAASGRRGPWSRTVDAGSD